MAALRWWMLLVILLVVVVVMAKQEIDINRDSDGDGLRDHVDDFDDDNDGILDKFDDDDDGDGIPDREDDDWHPHDEM